MEHESRHTKRFTSCVRKKSGVLSAWLGVDDVCVKKKKKHVYETIYCFLDVKEHCYFFIISSFCKRTKNAYTVDGF